MGSRNLQNLLTDREQVAAEIEAIVEEVSKSWGVKIESLLLKVRSTVGLLRPPADSPAPVGHPFQ